MAHIPVQINNKTYHISCNQGDENRIYQLAEFVNNKIRQTGGNTGFSDNGILIMTLLSMADDMLEEKNKHQTVTGQIRKATQFSLKSPVDEDIADYFEHLNQKIEQTLKNFQCAESEEFQKDLTSR